MFPCTARPLTKGQNKLYWGKRLHIYLFSAWDGHHDIHAPRLLNFYIIGRVPL
jgi:hypothetical protein